VTDDDDSRPDEDRGGWGDGTVPNGDGTRSPVAI
jgi:hypothetical protein